MTRIAAMSSGVAVSPASIAAGSPGDSRRMRKTMSATMNSTGIVAATRCRRKPSIAGSGYFFLSSETFQNQVPEPAGIPFTWSRKAMRGKYSPSGA